eukprot:scaffold332104_cov33-Prasinocladus_malaysianus.AAC.2
MAKPSTASVQAPGPVRSNVSMFVLPEKVCWAFALMWSQTAARAGCLAAPANTHWSSWALRE